MHHRSTATAAAALAIALCASLPARAQTARLGSLPASAQVVTNEQDAAALAALNAANAVISAALTNEAALRAAGDAAGLAALYGTNAVLRAALTNEAALRVEGDAAGLAALYGTNAVLRAALTNEAALRVSGTNEAAKAALRAYHYGSPDIVESPAEWFNGQGTIIGFISGPGRTNAVIPWAIGGVAVTNIGSTAFYPEGSTMPSTYHFGRFVKSIGAQAFFYNTDATHLYFSGDAPTVGANAFLNANEGLTATVINPQATGWGATLSDGTRSIPVIRPALHTDLMRIQVMQHVDSYTNLIWQSIYSNGWHWLVAVTNTPGGAQ